MPHIAAAKSTNGFKHFMVVLQLYKVEREIPPDAA
jgi:hypothetical protein